MDAASPDADASRALLASLAPPPATIAAALAEEAAVLAFLTRCVAPCVARAAPSMRAAPPNQESPQRPLFSGVEMDCDAFAAMVAPPPGWRPEAAAAGRGAALASLAKLQRALRHEAAVLGAAVATSGRSSDADATDDADIAGLRDEVATLRDEAAHWVQERRDLTRRYEQCLARAHAQAAPSSAVTTTAAPAVGSFESDAALLQARLANELIPRQQAWGDTLAVLLQLRLEVGASRAA